MVGKKSLLTLLASSIFFFSACESPSKYDVSVNQGETGDLVGRAVWDFDKDNIYTPTSANVLIDGTGIYGDTPSYEMETNNSGVFGFYGIPIGVHDIYIKKYDTYSHHWRYGISTSALVNRDQITDMGDVQIQCEFDHVNGCD